MRTVMPGLLLAALGAPAAAQTVSCRLWGVDTCTAVTTASWTDARVFWSDESVTQQLSLTTVSNSLVHNGTRDTSVVQQVFQRPGFVGNLGHVSTDPLGFGPGQGQNYANGNGPGAVVTYQVEKAVGAPPVVHHVDAFIGQVTSAALGSAGSTGGSPNMQFVTDGQSDFGLNRASTLVQFGLVPPQVLYAGNALKPGLTGMAIPSAHAETRSIWSDTMHVAGAAGGVVSFSVLLEGHLSANAFARYTLSVGGQSSGSLLDMTVDLTGAPGGYYSRTLTASLNVLGTSDIALTGMLQTRVDLPDALNSSGSAANPAFADFYDTARLTAITLSPGLTASYASGSANLVNITQVSSVPEPSAAWLLLAGGWALARRRRVARSPLALVLGAAALLPALYAGPASATATAQGTALVVRDGLQMSLTLDPGATLTLVQGAGSSVQTGSISRNGTDLIAPYNVISPSAPSMFDGSGPGYSYRSTADSNGPPTYAKAALGSQGQGTLVLEAQAWRATWFSLAGSGTGTITAWLPYEVDADLGADASESADFRAEAALGAGMGQSWLVPPARVAAHQRLANGVLTTFGIDPWQGTLQLSFQVSAGQEFYIASWASVQADVLSAPVPEPPPGALLLAGLLALGGWVRVFAPAAGRALR